MFKNIKAIPQEAIKNDSINGIDYIFTAEANFTSAKNTDIARTVLDALTNNMVEAINHSGTESMLDKLNIALVEFYKYRPELLAYGVPVKSFLLTEPILSKGLSQNISWNSLYTILFVLAEKMKEIDPAWADLGLVVLPDSALLLEYRGAYYSKEFDPSVDILIASPQTSSPNDDFSTLLKPKTQANITANYNIPASNTDQILSPLKTQQIAFLVNYNIGLEYNTKSNFQAAREYYLKAGAIFPQCAVIYQRLTEVSQDTGDYSEALHWANQYLAIDNNNPIIFSYRGEYYERFKEYNLAEADYLKALEIIKQHPEYTTTKNDTGILYSTLAAIAYNTGRYEKALQRAIKATQLISDKTGYYFINAYRIQLDCYNVLQNYAKLQEICDIMSVLPIESLTMSARTSIYYDLADAYCILGNKYNDTTYYTQQLYYADKSIALNMDNHPLPYFTRGWANLKLENYKQAEADFCTALRTAQNQNHTELLLPIYDNLSYIYRMEHNYRKSIRLADQGLQANPNFVNLYMCKGLAYICLNDLKKAGENLRIAQELFNEKQPFTKEAREGVLKTRKTLLRNSEAVELIDAFLAAFPE
ncbi:MAG: hypothetical protein LBD99_07625 [Candidatus Margulisbacteria bacterium]|jgi:tetratricopeptide (TPR) repeat protein|nr:hypothetical protein [Candidatus Margulisiibacteriota bacterium]